MINLPASEKLQVGILASVFNDTTNSYKYYWFLAILEEIKLNNSMKISFDLLFSKMLNFAWHPLNYYKLSFGKQDGFKPLVAHLNTILTIDNSTNSKPVVEQIQAALTRKEVLDTEKKISVLARWVPYRFIRPFFVTETKLLPDPKVNSTIKFLAKMAQQSDPRRSPYYLDKEFVIISKEWLDYFKQNMGVLESFTYWHLAKFLQKNNPNVIGITEKIFKPNKRILAQNIQSWKAYLSDHPQTICVYTKKNLTPTDFSIDHFIPWSYVVHDLCWNLIPVKKEANSSKSDNLPNINQYIDSFSYLQFQYLHFLIQKSSFHRFIEQYCLLFDTGMDELRDISINSFKTKLNETITPIIQIASNSGFNKDWIYKETKFLE